MVDLKTIRKLNGKKLSEIIENYNYNIYDFLNSDNQEMTNRDYNKLKNYRVKIIELKNDYNYDFIIKIKNFEAYCIF